VRPPDEIRLRRAIRALLWLFIIGLVLSGATAIPLENELKFITEFLSGPSTLDHWLQVVRDALVATNEPYPFLAYGTDWLAFGHFAIAIVFIGPLRDPVKNIWVIEFGIIACLAVIPYALIMGQLRGIPLYWRMIDCTFGILGIIPLLLCRRLTLRLASLTTARD